MPELPEVEAVCRLLREALETGATIVSAHIGRPSIVAPSSPSSFERRLRGRVIQSVTRRAKNVLIHMDRGEALRVHLRMTGDLYILPGQSERPATARVWLRLNDGREIVFEDSRALGRMEILTHTQLAGLDQSLGVEPLSPAFTTEWLVELARKSRTPAKLFLMDQTRIAGLGNIYAAEALFRAGLHPARPVSQISRHRLSALHEAIVGVLSAAVESAYREYSTPAQIPDSSFQAAVYGRRGEPCLRCRRRIRRIIQGGRSTYYCPGCQR